MRNQKGFIQIPLLIAIIAGVLVLGGGGYYGVKKYQNYQTEKIKKEIATQAEADAKQKAQDEAQQQKDLEVEKLKQEVEALKKTSSTKKYTNEISSVELKTYLSNVVKVSCNNTEGSGSLWKINGKYWVLTNHHVVSNPFKDGHCNVYYEENDKSGYFFIYPLSSQSWNSYSDEALMELHEFKTCTEDNAVCISVPPESIKYAISSLKKCDNEMSLGSPVVALGYPAFSERNYSVGGMQGDISTLIISNGIVSGYDSLVKKPIGNLPYSNYFISAKIDSGNSGGIVLSKDESGLCVLGIPTWLNLGNYETQGLVQNIHNIMYKP